MYESWNNTNSSAICIDLLCLALVVGLYRLPSIGLANHIQILFQLSCHYQWLYSCPSHSMLHVHWTLVCLNPTRLPKASKHSKWFRSIPGSLVAILRVYNEKSEKFVSTTPLEQSSETCRTTNPESFMLVNSTIAWRKTDVQSMHPQDESTSWKLNHHRATRVEVLWRIPKAIGVHGGLCWRKLARI